MATATAPAPGTTDDAGDGLFDPAPYTTPVPKIDGERADKIRLRVAGVIELDLADARDLAIVDKLRQGLEVPLELEARVDGKAWKTRTNEESGETETTYTVSAKIIRLGWSALAGALGVDLDLDA